MKNIKRLFIIFISIYFIYFSIFQHSIVVYASYGNHIYGETLYSDYESARKKGEIEDFIAGLFDDVVASGSFIASSLGAIVQGEDFEQFIKNYESFKDYMLSGNLVNDVVVHEDNSVSISTDLMSIIKQALQEYSEETNGYWLVPTMPMRNLSPSYFYSRSHYITMQNLINKYGIIGVLISDNNRDDPEIRDGKFYNLYSSYYALDFSPYISPDYNIVSTSSSWDGTNTLLAYIYDSDWKKIYMNGAKYIYDDIIYSSLDDINSISSSFEQAIIRRKGMNEGYFFRSTTNTYTTIISKDGCRIRVFKSVNAMKSYDVGERTVYFGSDFYEKEPTEITITIDDFNKYLDTDFDKYFGELKDTIISQGSNLSEQDVEKLTDSLLDKLTDIDNSIGNVGDSVQESNNLLSQILAKLDNIDKNVSSILANIDNKVSSTLDFSGIEERLDTIIASLGIISGQLDDMTAEEVESKTDDAIKEMQNEFSEIGELAKTKFPLSLPWDIFGMLKMLGGGAAGSGEDAPETVSLLLDSESDTFVHTMSLYGDNGIVLYDDGGSHESSSGTSHGGGGHSRPGISSDSLHGGEGGSRWGAWLSDTGAPIFYMPVEFSKSMQIGGLLIIDLSGFEIIHNIGRIMFTIIFCMNLIHLTFKAISAGKDVLTW